jgi:hypothetical protein
MKKGPYPLDTGLFGGLPADYSAFFMAFRYMEFFGLEKTRSTIGSKNSSGSLS